jgi:hypothetical protein
MPTEPEPIPHEPDKSGNCKHCGYPAFGNGFVSAIDCPKRRLWAMAEAVGRGRAGVHVVAVDRWHLPLEPGHDRLVSGFQLPRIVPGVQRKGGSGQ